MCLVVKFLAYFAGAPYSVTVKRLDNSVKPETVTRLIIGLLEFFPEKATLKLSSMSNGELKFFIQFCIVHIKSV